MSGQWNSMLDTFLVAWSDWMWNISLHVTWLVAILWFMDRLLRHVSARLRFFLWSLVLIRLVIPPGWSIPTGLGWWLGDVVAEQANRWTWLVSAPVPADALTDTMANGSATRVTQVTAELANTRTVWRGGLFTMWLGFVTAQLAWLLYGWWQVRRWLAQATRLTDLHSQQVLSSAKARAGFRGSISLYDSGMCVTPLVVGYWRPKILLPTVVRQTLSQPELETVVVHELTHLSRGDIWWRISQAILGTVYFFHPAVWLARYRLNQLCEEACDEQTVRALSGQRRDYAQAIVKAATVVGYQPPYLAVNMVGDALPVKRRLQRILDPALPWRTTGRWQHGLILLVAALVLLPGSARSGNAIPPQQARLSGLPFVRENADDAPDGPTEETTNPSSALNQSTPAQELAEEQQALAFLQSTDFELRMSGYQLLERVGTPRSLPALEAAFLNRSGIEQDAAKRALDRVWNIIRQQPSEVSQPIQRNYANNSTLPTP